jgi:hypothetical protein
MLSLLLRMLSLLSRILSFAVEDPLFEDPLFALEDPLCS